MNIQSAFTVYTAALHALILILFSLHTSGLGYPGLTLIYCISTNKSFSSSKTSSRKPYTNSKQQERQKHSAEITINLSLTCESAREHRATKHLWPNGDATPRFPSRAWREGALFWRAQRICRWSRTPCSATGRGGVICLCEQHPCLAGHKKTTAAAPIHPDLPTCKAKADDWGLRLRNQDYLDVLYASQVAL